MRSTNVNALTPNEEDKKAEDVKAEEVFQVEKSFEEPEHKI